MREKQKLEAQGLVVGPKLLAEKLNVRERDVIEMEQRLSAKGAEMSLDAPVSGLGDQGGRQTSYSEFLEDPHERIDDQLARQELLSLVKSELPRFEVSLNEKEQKVLSQRLLAEEPKTLQEVADFYGMTRERVRQIEAKVISKLRQFLGRSLE